MRFFTTVAAFALAATVSAQNATATTASLSPQQTCLRACQSNDICCQAACVGVPCPNEAQVNATTSCAGQCHQGNGTEAETNAYAACQSSCISSYFLSSTAAAAATRASGASGAAATATSASGTHTGTASHASGTASNTASGASASATGNSAPQTRVALAGAGLFGLLIAGLAL